MGKDKRRGWLAELTVGDSVIVHRGWMASNVSIKKVEKITPTGQLVVDGDRYGPDGDKHGSDRYSKWWLKEATSEAVAKINQTRLEQSAIYALERLTEQARGGDEAARVKCIKLAKLVNP